MRWRDELEIRRLQTIRDLLWAPIFDAEELDGNDERRCAGAELHLVLPVELACRAHSRRTPRMRFEHLSALAWPWRRRCPQSPQTPRRTPKWSYLGDMTNSMLRYFWFFGVGLKRRRVFVARHSSIISRGRRGRAD
eukprot:6176306-Pleurochrysis_carterae.AAC.6